MRKASPEVWNCVAPVVSSMGFQFVGAHFGQADSGLTLRVYIDHEDGIDIENCADVSRQLSAVLDVEEPISAAYFLEVSSPGVDRPLFTVEDFKRYQGQVAKINMAVPHNGRRRFKGEIISAEDGIVVLEVDGIDYDLTVADIEQAQLVYQF